MGLGRSLGVREVVRAKLEYHSSRRSGKSTIDYLVLRLKRIKRTLPQQVPAKEPNKRVRMY